MQIGTRFTLLVSTVLFTSFSVWASITGSISGLVTDPSGGVVAGAQVIAIETHTGIKTETHTDSKGFYSFPTLAIGTYDLEVHAPGFKSASRWEQPLRDALGVLFHRRLHGD